MGSLGRAYNKNLKRSRFQGFGSRASGAKPRRTVDGDTGLFSNQGEKLKYGTPKPRTNVKS